MRSVGQIKDVIISRHTVKLWKLSIQKSISDQEARILDLNVHFMIQKSLQREFQALIGGVFWWCGKSWMPVIIKSRLEEAIQSSNRWNEGSCKWNNFWNCTQICWRKAKMQEQWPNSKLRDPKNEGTIILEMLGKHSPKLHGITSQKTRIFETTSDSLARTAQEMKTNFILNVQRSTAWETGWHDNSPTNECS